MRSASEGSEQERYMARWYENFIDICKAATRRDLALICHPSNKSAMMDMIERVVEDERWPGGDPPPLVVYSKMKPGEYQLIDESTKKILTMREAMKSNGGLGRYRNLYTPDESLRRDE